MSRLLAAFLALLLLAAPPALAQSASKTPAAPASSSAAPSFSADQQQEIERIVRDYLARNPEVIIEALQAADARMKSEEEARAKQALGERKRDLFEDPASPVLGNPKGDVTLVEFFDYRCPYCKQVHPAIQALIGEDKQLRVVMKEFPILGKESVFASRAALAAHRQGKYEALHNALLAAKGQLTDEIVLKTAGAVGIDVEKLKADMNRPEIEAQIKSTYELAQALQIHGTPAFLVGGEIIPGAVDVATLRRRIADARKG